MEPNFVKKWEQIKLYGELSLSIFLWRWKVPKQTRTESIRNPLRLYWIVPKLVSPTFFPKLWYVLLKKPLIAQALLVYRGPLCIYITCSPFQSSMILGLLSNQRSFSKP